MPKARLRTDPKAASPSRGPAQHPSAPSTTKTVLLAVTGLSPAIVTETVWALAQEGREHIPARVLFITTGTGARKIEEQLFTPQVALGGVCAWEALRSALGVGPDQLQAEPVCVLAAPNPNTGRMEPLEDIKTPAQNSAAANLILERVRAYVENPELRLVASIAGGRKTMGALLHAAMTLLARETDRITHVLVSSPFESTPGFFFPAQPGGALADRSGGSHDPATAVVHLADVPFVPLRNRFKELNQMPGTFEGLIRSFSNLLKADVPCGVRLDYAGKRMEVDGQWIDCPRSVLFVAHFLLGIRQKGVGLRDQKEAGSELLLWMEGGNPKGVDAKFLPPVDKQEPAEYIRKKLSDLRRLLEKAGVRWQVPARDLSLKGAELLE